MAWRPLHPQHAIERTRLVIGFDQPILEKPAAKAAAMFEARASSLQFGPRINTNAAFVSIAMMGSSAMPQPQVASVPGWIFTRVMPDGRPIEAFGLNGNEIFYEVSEYGQWALLQERLGKVLGEIPAFFAETFMHRVTSLEYQNRFVYHGEPTEADVRLLIGPLASAIPEDAARGLKMWHLHRGWFQTEDGRDVLVNQNMDVQDGQLTDEKSARSLLIVTNVVKRYEGAEDGVEALGSDLHLLHDVAKREFSRALLPDVSTRLGIDPS